MAGAWGLSWGQSWGMSFGQTQLSAPSGMRRLQLYQLQEEALKQLEKKEDEQVQGQETPSGASESTPPEPVATPKPRTRRAKRRPTAQPKPYVVIPWNYRPAVSSVSVPDELRELPPLPNYILAAFRRKVIINLETERIKRRKRARRRAAAFLLMAA